MNGFLASPHVQAALLASAVVAILSAAAGYFVVVRALSFAGHAVADIGLTGGAAALLVGVAPLWGLLAFSVVAALAIGALGERARERDVATGLVLAVALGLGALFLHLQTRYANAQTALLFGSIFDTDPAVVAAIVVVAVAALAVLAVLFRPLVFASVSADAARVAGVPVNALGLAFLATLAIAVAETAQVVGVLIATALLIGPAATAARLVREPLASIALACAIGVAQMWLAIACAYASVTWTPERGGWPISFFMPALALATYVVTYATTSGGPRGRTRPARADDPVTDGRLGVRASVPQNALAAGLLVAVVAGCVGYFVVVRGSAFATHALSQIGFAGAAGAVLIGVQPLVGLIAFALLGAFGLGVGTRARGNDVTTALVLVAALGTGALFLALGRSYGSNVFALLFGTIVGVDRSDVAITGIASALALVALLAIARPLLFATVARDAAIARGVPVATLDFAFLAIVALSAAVAVPVVGTLLIYSLTVGPAAAAVRLSARPAVAMMLAVALAAFAVVVGLALAVATDWPVGFFIATVAALEYGGARLYARRRNATAP